MLGAMYRLRIQTELEYMLDVLDQAIQSQPMGSAVTVIDWVSNWYATDVSRESLNRTTLGRMASRPACEC